MAKYLVVQTTTIEGPAGPTYTTADILSAVEVQAQRQAKTKDTWVIAEEIPAKSWYMRLITWLARL